MHKEIEAKIIAAKKIVVFSGAGFSTESGIPDFRSSDGLYSKKTYGFSCEEMLSHTFFIQYPELFYQFYKNEMIHQDAKPNVAHQALCELQKQGKLLAVVTQNIDGLHQAAHVDRVIELHGSVHRNYCMKCHAFYDLDDVMASDGIPYCEKCGGIIKPDVVLYEESLSQQVIEKAIKAIAEADLLIVAGTSLQVYPAAGFVKYFNGDAFIILNRDATSMDDAASIVSRNAISEELAFLIEK